MRVEVDHAVCEANAICEGLAPTVFQLDDEDRLHILRADVPAELQDAVRDAVDRCPKVALRLADSG